MDRSCCIKNKLKSEILNNNNNKKYKLKCLSAITKNLNWQISTKNIVTFKRQYGLKMKNVNIMGVLQFLGEGGVKKKQNNTYGKLPKKGLRQFAEGLAKNKEGVDTSMHTMI